MIVSQNPQEFYAFIILLCWEIFTSALADGFLPESEWQQTISSLQDFSQYSSRSRQCCSLDGLQFLLFSTPSISLVTLWWLYRVYQIQVVSPSLSWSIVFQLSRKVSVLTSLFAFLKFYTVVSQNGKSIIRLVVFFLLTITSSGQD